MIHYDNLAMNWVGDWIGRRAALTPSRPALLDSATGLRFTYRELDDRANRVGAFFVDELRLQKGDRVSFLSRNRVECVDLYFAAGKLGLVLAPLSYRLAPTELESLLDRIQPAVFFVEGAFDNLASRLRLPESVRETIRFEDTDGEYQERVLATPPRVVNRPLAMNEPFLYVHTGGSTGTPKLCVVSHRQMVWNSFDLIATGSGGMGLEGKELVTFPFFHVGGWNTVTPIFHTGGQVILLREFDADLALNLIEREGATHFGGVEAMFRLMIQSPSFVSTDLSSVRYINSAGAPCSPDAMKPFWDRGIPVTQSYGLTEAGPSNFILLPDGLEMEEVRAVHASIGGPMFHCDVRLVDPETGKDTAPGEPGEIWLRSPHGFDGYLDDPAKTDTVLREDGWVRSGDLAQRDPSDRFRIIGRADNMFVSGGENIAPEEIESALMCHPEVAVAGVAARPHNRWGQVGVAFIVPTPAASLTAERLQEYCSTRLGRFKIPAEFRFVETLPLTGAGKIDRKALARLASC